MLAKLAWPAEWIPNPANDSAPCTALVVSWLGSDEEPDRRPSRLGHRCRIHGDAIHERYDFDLDLARASAKPFKLTVME